MNPHEILFTWQGGMSFHGGLLGVLVAMWLLARRHRLPYFVLMDMLAVAAPIGLFFGRVANFINGELFGRVVDVPWAMIFPAVDAGPYPRHPSQLYEAALEGALLFVLLFALARWTRLREAPGVLSGLFLIGYGLARIVVENYREPDAHLGFVWGELSMGQLLSLPMALFGLLLLFRAWRQQAAQRKTGGA